MNDASVAVASRASRFCFLVKRPSDSGGWRRRRGRKRGDRGRRWPERRRDGRRAHSVAHVRVCAKEPAALEPGGAGLGE